MQNKKGILFILISSLCFGSYGIWSRLLGGYFDPLYQGWSRALVIAIVLTPFLFYQRGFISIARRDWGWMAVYLLFTSLTQAPIFYAFNHMDVGTATLLFFVSFLLTMYLAGFLSFNERFTRVKAISFILACIGLSMTFSFSAGAFSIFAASMAVLNGVASGGEVAFSKKLSGAYSPLYLTWLSWLVIVATNAPLSFALGETFHMPAFDIAWAYQAGYIIASIFGFWLIIEGLRHVEASIGGLLGLLEIVFSISLGFIIFGEVLTGVVIAGGVLILCAAALPHVASLAAARRTVA